MNLKELNEQILVVPFVELEPHLKRGAVIVIDESLDLAEVGLLMANDNKAAIVDLLNEHLMTKASSVDYEAWRREKRFFKFLVIQPFVVVQNYVALSPTKH